MRSIEDGANHCSGGDASAEPKKQSKQNRLHAIYQDEAQHLGSLRAAGQTDADFLDALGDEIGEHSIEPNRSQQK